MSRATIYLRKFILKAIIFTILSAIVLSTLSICIAFSKTLQSFEGKQAVTIVTVLNAIIITIQGIVCLVSLYISTRKVYTNKKYTAVVYYLPLVPLLIVAIYGINIQKTSTDMIWSTPVFSFIAFTAVWTYFYLQLKRRLRFITQKRKKE